MCNFLYPVFAKFGCYCGKYCPDTEIMLIVTSMLDHLTHPGANCQNQIVNPYELNELLLSLLLLKYSNTRMWLSAHLEPVIQRNSWVGPSANNDHSCAVKNTFPLERSFPKELHLEDVQTDEDKLNSSLLSSESTFMPVASGLSPVSPASDLKLHGISLGQEDDDDTVTECVRDVNNSRETTNKQEALSVTGEHPNRAAGSVETQENIKEVLQVPAPDPGTAGLAAKTGNSLRASEGQVLHSHPSASLGAESGVKTLCPDQMTEERSGSLAVQGAAPADQGAAELQRMTEAATKLQASWRGFYTRNYHPRAKEVRNEIRLNRMQEHIICLTAEIEK